MLELAVRTFLSNQIKSEIPQDSHYFIRLENGDTAILARGSNSDRLGADEFRFQARFTILQQHGHHFPKVLLQLVKRLTLRVGTWKTGNKPHKQSGLRTFFDNSSEGMHLLNNIIPITHRKSHKEQRKEERLDAAVKVERETAESGQCLKLTNLET